MAAEGKVAPISDMFNGILACAVRADPNGPSEMKTFKSAKGQHIQHWIMLVPMPPDIDSSEYIPLFIRTFQSLCKKSTIRSAYHSGMLGITQNSVLLNAISEEGNYWNVIENAHDTEIIFRRSEEHT